jgi:ketosteroid isomerase-like protein
MMKKKNGVNIMLFVFIINLIMILSCTKNSKREAQGILLKTDREFSTMSAGVGMYRAFLFYAADSGVLLRDNSYPLVGRQALGSLFEKGTDSSFVLTWEPLFEKLSESGDLGYTYGVFTSTIKVSGSTARGTYVTIWQKQKDGSWKFVLDTGTQGLPDASE